MAGKGKAASAWELHLYFLILVQVAVPATTRDAVQQAARGRQKEALARAVAALTAECMVPFPASALRIQKATWVDADGKPSPLEIVVQALRRPAELTGKRGAAAPWQIGDAYFDVLALHQFLHRLPRLLAR